MKAEIELGGIRRVAKAEKRVPKWVMPLVKACVVSADGLLAAAAFLLAYTIRVGEPILSPTAWTWSEAFVPYAGILLFAVPVRILMMGYQRAYVYHGAFSYTREAIKIFKAVSVGSLLIIGWAFLFRGGFAFREFSYSRGVFVLDFLIALAVFAAFHLGVRFVQAQFRRRDINLIPTLVVGTNGEAEKTIRELTEQLELGYRVMGVVETGKPAPSAVARAAAGGFRSPVSLPRITVAESKLKSQVLGELDDLPYLIRELEIQEVIITDSTLPSDKLFDVMMQLGRKQKVEFRFAPSLIDVLPQKTSVEQIGVLPMVRLFREPLSDADRFLKRASDIVMSLAAIVLLSPVWLAISLLIKLGSRGPAVFKQERVGMDGRIFLCYKFRTMHSDSDEGLHREAYLRNIEGIHDSEDPEDAAFGKVKDDPRITKVGRWLRRSSLDELPQLLNVLKGDMSIVGPRPPIPYEVEEYEMRHRRRLDMKPGMTGLWQVSGRSRLSFKEMVRIDIYYIENWSLWLDLKILLLTLPAVLRGDGAR